MKRLRLCQPPPVVEWMRDHSVPMTYEAVRDTLRVYFGRDFSRSDIEAYLRELQQSR